jgi:hypothetical protein
MEQEKTVNIQQRIRNLTPESPLSAWKSVLDALIDAVRSESLKTSKVTETEDQRQARRAAINETKTTLLDLLEDPDAKLAEWREEQRQQQEQELINANQN